MTLCPKEIKTRLSCCLFKCSKVVGTFSGVFGKVKKALENDRKSSEAAGTFSKITGDHSKAEISRI